MKGLSQDYTPSTANIEALQTINEFKAEFTELLWDMQQAYLIQELREGTPTQPHLIKMRTNLNILKQLVLNS